MSEDNKIIDPWLYPGCICEVWGNGVEKVGISLGYFLCHQHGMMKFKVGYGSNRQLAYSCYRPVGTPWDFAPKGAHSLIIDTDAVCYFVDEYDDPIYICETCVIFPWPACPDHLKGKTLPRPEWAKEGK